MAEIVLRVPSDLVADFQTFWKELRVAEALEPEADLTAPTISDNFDGAAVGAWVLEIKPYLAPVLSAVFTYLVAKRGELEIQKGDTTIRMKNLKPSQLKEFLAALDEHL